MSVKGLSSEEAQAKSLATRKERAQVVNMRSLVRRRRNPGEIPTKQFAIQNFCRECMGWEADGCSSLAQAIRECTAPECWLYPWRNGHLEAD